MSEKLVQVESWVGNKMVAATTMSPQEFAALTSEVDTGGGGNL